MELNKSGGSYKTPEGTVLTFHTHPSARPFSPADIKSAFEGKVPMLQVDATAGPGRGTAYIYIPPSHWPAGVPFPNERPNHAC